MKKIKIGIELNEVIRNRFINFDRYYNQEFGENSILDENVKYVYDLFNGYKWEDTEKSIKYLKDVEEIPENMSPIEYHKDIGDKKSGDDFLFNTIIEKKTAKENYNKFLFEDFSYEIHGMSPMMYSNLNVDIQKLMKKYKDNVEFYLISEENNISIPHSLFFLGKNNFKFKNYKFIENYENLWKDIDIFITSNPILFKEKKLRNKIIKVRRPYNINKFSTEIEITQINELLKNNLLDKLIKKTYLKINNKNETIFKKLLKKIKL